MRRRFDAIGFGTNSHRTSPHSFEKRDELPPILAGLEWIFQTFDLNEQVFIRLEFKVVAGKSHRPARSGSGATARPECGAFRIGL